MSDTFKNDTTVRDYLLGRIGEEAQLSEIEDKLFADEKFCSLAEVIEDSLINDYVFGKLNNADNADFKKTFLRNPDRRAKVTLANALKEKAAEQAVAQPVTKDRPSFWASIRAFFTQPLNAGAFAALLIGVLLLSLFVLNRGGGSELAELRSIYEKERPIETRISEFNHAPLIVTRGEAEEREKSKLRRIENTLLEAAEKDPSAKNLHALGVFYLTQRKFDDAITQLENAVKADPKFAKAANDLGSAFFEKAKASTIETRFELFARALENFSIAWETDPALLEALYNRALSLQEMRLLNQAQQAWELYLQKDAASGWAAEARKNLERLQEQRSTFKTKEQVLADFLAAYRADDTETVWKINSQTREMLTGVWLPDQLTRRFLDAKARGDDPEAAESLAALKYIGDLEKTRNVDFFVSDLAQSYGKATPDQITALRKAKAELALGYEMAPKGNDAQALQHFETAKQFFDDGGSKTEQLLADYWIGFSGIGSGDKDKFVEAKNRLDGLRVSCGANKFRWLDMVTVTRLGDMLFARNSYSEAVAHVKEVLRNAQAISDTLYQQRSLGTLASTYIAIGETQKSFTYYSKLFQINDLYYQAYFQNLRGLGEGFDQVKMLDLRRASIDLALEFKQAISQNSSDAAILFEAETVVAEMYAKNGNYDMAANSLLKGGSILETINDAGAKEIRLGYLNLFQGNLDRLFGNYEKATVEYSKVIEAYPEATEYMPDLFFAHKGRLISREQLGYGDTFQEEIEIALEFLKKYRDRITEDENRNSFFDREQSVTNIAAGFYLKQNDPEKAFDLIESAKARSLLDIITGNGKYDSAENQIIFSGSTKSEGLREIQQKLPEDIQMLQYAVLESKIVIWLVERNASFVEIVPARSEELSTQVKQFLDQIKTRSPEANLTSQKLYEPLIAPIEAKLDAKKQLVIVPDGMLYEVPFAALKKRDGHFLIEDRAISYAPSASTFIALTQKAAQTLPGEKLLAVGNPDFDRAANSAFAPLPAARKEAEAIATLYPNSNKLLEAEAKKLAVLSELRDTDVFHFAGHYAVSPASPLNSKLLLAKPEGAGDEFSGELRAFEILNTKPAHLKLVVLSACETGLERVFQGEGAVGMARTFLAAGAPLVIASQWKVESDSTSELMTAFHRHRRENKLPSAEALRRAQLEILRRAEYAEPYFWSAFAAVGAYANY